MNHDKRRTRGTHRAHVALAPMAIRVRTASRTLEIDWQDGLTSRWGHRLLRQRCRCAECSAQQRSGSGPAAAPDVALIQVASCGQNALQLTFSDGHARGIFPFAYLRQLAGHDYGVTTS